MRKYYISVTNIIFIIITIYLPFAEEKHSEKEPIIYNINLKQIKTLLSENKQGLTIINLWATWCPPCVAELPHFGNIYEKYPKEKVHLYLINVEGKEIKEKVLEPFLKKNLLPCPVYLLEEGTPEELEKVLKTEISGALPITLIYNSGGKLLKKFEESISEEDIRYILKENGINEKDI